MVPVGIGKQPDPLVVAQCFDTQPGASGDGVRLNGYSHDGSTQGATPRFQRVPAAPYASGAP